MKCKTETRQNGWPWIFRTARERTWSDGRLEFSGIFATIMAIGDLQHMQDWLKKLLWPSSHLTDKVQMLYNIPAINIFNGTLKQNHNQSDCYVNIIPKKQSHTGTIVSLDSLVDMHHDWCDASSFYTAETRIQFTVSISFFKMTVFYFLSFKNLIQHI